MIGPRLSNARWEACCRKAEIVSTCDRKIGDTRAALELLAVAHGDCLDHVFAAVEKYSPGDLAAAYFIRAQRKANPVDYLHALNAAYAADSDAALFNRALIEQTLGLTREAIQSWDAVVRSESSDWSSEARVRRDRLMETADPANRLDLSELDGARLRRDRVTLQRITSEFPADAMRYFEGSDVLDLEASRAFAEALGDAGDPYASAIVDAVAQATDRNALRQGIAAFAGHDYERAAALLKRANNPLSLAAQYRQASAAFASGHDPMKILDLIAPVASKQGYRDLAARIHTLRASALEQNGRYLEAMEAYQQALQFTGATPTVDVLARRSANYTILGDPEEAFRNSFAAISLLPSVANLNARHQAFGSAAMATRELAYPAIALQFQNAAIDVIQKAVVEAPATGLKRTKHHFAIALRGRADIHVALGHDAAAEADLQQASDLAEAAELSSMLPLLRMRLAEVRGHQALAKGNFTEALARFSEAIALAEDQHSTYRAALHYKRALARGDTPEADEDRAAALSILRDEAIRLRDSVQRGEYERLWKPYFSRFQEMYHQMIERRIQQNDVVGAFVYAEQARAFEPMQLLLQSGAVPPGFRKIEASADLLRMNEQLPADTLILQYVVLKDRTYTWALSRDRPMRLFPSPVGSSQIEGWVERVRDAVESGRDALLTTTMRAAYEQLFRAPLASSPHTRIVIVPDGPMHGLPFAALQGTKGEGYLIQHRSIAVAGSTSLYLYTLHRDRQFKPDPRPAVLVVGEPALDDMLARQYALGPLVNALEEARQLARDYEDATLLTGREATAKRFLDSAKSATIIHFAGHGVANALNPWQSMLILAPDGRDPGDLTAERLLSTVQDLQHTRLIVLAACSTTSGKSVGPEGLAPLVRPLIAARVPSVVGTLWDVKDTATIKDLLVSLHRHYRNGDDVAVALQKAQLAMLREPARTWAPFQVIGYATSPYERPAALEETRNEHFRTQDSLHRPDGFHSQ